MQKNIFKISYIWLSSWLLGNKRMYMDVQIKTKNTPAKNTKP